MKSVDLGLLDVALQASVVTMTFTKADGSLRDMVCTKNFDFVPASKTPASVRTGRDVSVVFDLEVNDWRSFKPSSVISWTV